MQRKMFNNFEVYSFKFRILNIFSVPGDRGRRDTTHPSMVGWVDGRSGRGGNYVVAFSRMLWRCAIDRTPLATGGPKRFLSHSGTRTSMIYIQDDKSPN